MVVRSAERIRLPAVDDEDDDDDGSGDEEAMPYTVAGEATASAGRATVSARPRPGVEHEGGKLGEIP